MQLKWAFETIRVWAPFLAINKLCILDNLIIYSFFLNYFSIILKCQIVGKKLAIGFLPFSGHNLANYWLLQMKIANYVIDHLINSNVLLR
jgi:hypothetical protein